MKRFGFLTILLLAAGCADLAAIRERLSECDVRERVGILAHLDIGWEASTKPMMRALAHFRSAGVDRVVILGDPTKDGYANQRTVFETAWRKAFSGATPPERILATNEYALGGIAFADAGRFPLTDLICVHPKDGRRILAGSMHGFDVSGVFDKQDSRTVSAFDSSAQGLLVLVRDEGLEVRRLDFSGAVAEEVGPPWRVGRDGLIESEGEAVPRFWPDTAVSVTPGYDKKGDRLYTVRWPPVLAKHTGARAFSYDVSVGNEVLRRVQSAGFCRSEERDGAAVRCVVSAEELKGREPRFGITPISSLGKRGPTVWSR